MNATDPAVPTPARPRRRWRWALWGAASYLGILAAVATGLLLLYDAARTRLDDALGQRLLGIARTAAYLVDGDKVTEWAAADPEPLELVWLESRLQRLRREDDLAEISLCDPAGFVVISASGRLEKNDLDVFWDLDPAAVALAQTGQAAASRLYRVGELYQKSAHAPILDAAGEVAAVLTVDGSADFFDSLATLRRGALVTGAAVLVFLTLMGVVLVRADLALQRYRASLARQETLAAMGRMTAGIAHEIRNPLSIIRGTGEHLGRLLAEHGVQDEAVAFIPEEVDRLDRILGDYLAFGSDSAGRAEDLDLAVLIRRTVRLVRGELEASDVQVALPESLPAAPARGDARRLQQVLMNLLLNARDAMPTGGLVSLGLAAAGDAWRLTVSDEGGGLTDAAARRAFEPFWTSKEKGSGLGLAVSRRIARAHGGELTLAARADGPGAVATLTLPRAAPSAAGDPGSTPAAGA